MNHLGETGPLSQGVQAGRKVLRIRYINNMEVRKKRPRGFKKEAQGAQVSPLNPLELFLPVNHLRVVFAPLPLGRLMLTRRPAYLATTPRSGGSEPTTTTRMPSSMPCGVSGSGPRVPSELMQFMRRYSLTKNFSEKVHPHRNLKAFLSNVLHPARSY
jgi:hypothetical protein